MAGAKCAALAGSKAVLNALPSPTHFDTNDVGSRCSFCAALIVVRSGGHH